MDIRWSPRKRIKLGGIDQHVSKNPLSSVCPATPVSPLKPAQNSKKHSLKRAATDFDKELDELLEPRESSFNPTQMFLADPEMELAMLRADQEQVTCAFPSQPPKRSSSRSLARWDTAPFFDSSNHPSSSTNMSSEMKRHVSDPSGSFIKTQVIPSTNNLIDELDGIDINELTAAIDNAENLFASANKTGQTSTQDCTQRSLSENEAVSMFSTRCTVVQVPIYCSDGSGVGIQVTEDSSGLTRLVLLEGVWKDSLLEDPWQVQPGDVIHVLAGPSKAWVTDQVVIGDSEALFPDLVVFHPDNVLSSTTLSASATCSRRSVIQNRVLAPEIGPVLEDEDDINRALSPIIGNCVHEAVQAAAAVNDFSEQFVFQAGEKALQEQMLTGIWECGSTPFAVLNQLRNRLSHIARWGRETWPRLASRLRGCEVEIRPKSLGVTGKLDMDIEDTTGARSCIEIKTGKHHAIHVGQVVLYYLLQYVDKYGNPDKAKAANLPHEISQEYILLYLQASSAAESIKVKITAREAQNIMRNRNLIASHNVRQTLPGPIFKQGDCQFCPTRRECAAHFLEETQTGKQEEAKRFFKATQFTRKDCSIKEELLAYQKKWLEWINSQQYSEQVGGLSAVRRMRGNLLSMVTQCLIRESGVHEGKDLFFHNYMKVLVGKSPSISQPTLPSGLGNWLKGYYPKNRVGRIALVSDVGPLDNKSELNRYLVNGVIKPLIEANEKILLCGTSNASIDSVLVEVSRCGLKPDVLNKITRLGSKPEDFDEVVRENFRLPEDWMERVDEIEKTRLMFACTVKGVHNDILSRGDFSAAVVLGADKLTDAAGWGVLLRARQTVLVGKVHEAGDQDEYYLFQRLRRANHFPTVEAGAQETQEPVVVDLD